MGGTSDVTVDEAKASIARAEEAKASLLSGPKRLFLSEAFNVLDDLDDDGTGELGAPFIITDSDGKPMAAVVPPSVIRVIEAATTWNTAGGAGQPISLRSPTAAENELEDAVDALPAQGAGWCAPSP